MKTCSALIVPASVMLVLVGGCDRPSEPTSKTEPAIQVVAPDEVPAEPESQISDPAPVAAKQGDQRSTDNWRTLISREDSARMAKIDQAWTVALASARKDGFDEEVRALGVVAMPLGATEGHLQPAPGNYNCRTIKLGLRGNVGPGLVTYPYFRCRVALTPGGDLIIEKTTGSQRFKGLLYPESDTRLAFVGTQAWGDEKGFPAYGSQPERDETGYLERIGNGQWRLLIPFPKHESLLDIIEIVA